MVDMHRRRRGGRSDGGARRGLVAVVLPVALLVSCGVRGRALDPAEQVQAKHVESVLHMQYPFKIAKWGRYLDGGTLSGTITDAWGRPFQFAVDGRMFQIPPESLQADSFRIPPRHVYIGASHPTAKGARELPILGYEERAVLDMLDLLSVDVLTRVRRDSLVAIVLSRQHVWNRAFRDLSEDQRHALDAGTVAIGRRRMNPAGSVLHGMKRMPPNARRSPN